MRRALTILKYLPAVLCGLLVVAWVVSLFCHFGFEGTRAAFAVAGGSLEVAIYQQQALSGGRFFDFHSIHWTTGYLAWDGSEVIFPIPFLLTLLLPFAIGPFNRFRFPLWSYFAFTALVAVELAYYLR